MLFNEPKLLKWDPYDYNNQRLTVSVLFNEPKLLKSPSGGAYGGARTDVSVLFNEPKLLKSINQKKTE